jgi:hypothetical protein
MEAPAVKPTQEEAGPELAGGSIEVMAQWGGAEQGFEKPDTWDELMAIADDYGEIGKTPLSIGGLDGWPLTDWSESLYITQGDQIASNPGCTPANRRLTFLSRSTAGQGSGLCPHLRGKTSG